MKPNYSRYHSIPVFIFTILRFKTSVLQCLFPFPSSSEIAFFNKYVYIWLILNRESVYQRHYHGNDWQLYISHCVHWRSPKNKTTSTHNRINRPSKIVKKRVLFLFQHWTETVLMFFAHARSAWTLQEGSHSSLECKGSDWLPRERISQVGGMRRYSLIITHTW